MPRNSLKCIQVITDDLTTLHVDAIVNAANASLLGGGGVDGAVHRAAGERLLEFNRSLGGCKTGQAKLAPSFDLADIGIKHIIHTVGPVWDGDASSEIGQCEQDVLLAACYDNSLKLAAAQCANAVAFPAISTGVYGFPKERAAAIAVQRVVEWLDINDLPARVIFCCFDDVDTDIYHETIDRRRACAS